MTTYTTTEDLVAAGVEAQFKIDKHLARAKAAAKDLEDITEQGVAMGLVQGIAAKIIIAQAVEAYGMIGATAKAFAVLHVDQTAACVAAGVDMGSVETAGGVTIGGVHTEGGGR